MDEIVEARPAARLRVLVVARQPVARAGLRGLLEDSESLEVAGQAASAEDAAASLAERVADAVLTTWDGSHVEEIVSLAEVAAARGVPLVIMADAPGAAELAAVMRAGVRGVLLSDATADELDAALHAASQGLLVLDPLLGPTWSSLIPAVERGDLLHDEPLTEREREVLGLLALGLANKNIAKRLGISEHTVKFHVGSILSKLDAGSRTEAVTRAARRGLLAL